MGYFYGPPISKAYKLPTRCALVSYEEAVSINARVAPVDLNAKLEAGKNLDDVEEHLMAGYACLEDELKDARRSHPRRVLKTMTVFVTGMM